MHWASFIILHRSLTLVMFSVTEHITRKRKTHTDTWNFHRDFHCEYSHREKDVSSLPHLKLVFHSRLANERVSRDIRVTPSSLPDLGTSSSLTRIHSCCCRCFPWTWKRDTIWLTLFVPFLSSSSPQPFHFDLFDCWSSIHSIQSVILGVYK